LTPSGPCRRAARRTPTTRRGCTWGWRACAGCRRRCWASRATWRPRPPTGNRPTRGAPPGAPEMSSPLDQVGADLESLLRRVGGALEELEHLGGPVALAGDPAALRAAAGAWRGVAGELRGLEADLRHDARRTVP